jgi:uncharacterized membrane-anchored protein
MKPMIWHPEENDEKVNQYLDSINHEPWLMIFASSILIISMFLFFVVIGTF